jgi:hypothetical protein
MIATFLDKWYTNGNLISYAIPGWNEGMVSEKNLKGIKGHFRQNHIMCDLSAMSFLYAGKPEGIRYAKHK